MIIRDGRPAAAGLPEGKTSVRRGYVVYPKEMSRKLPVRNRLRPDPEIAGQSGGLDRILGELQALRASVESLHRNDSPSRTPQPKEERFGVFITRVEGTRKPFLIQTEGVISTTFRLSSIRAAILVVLLLDLEDRLEGGAGVSEPLVSIERTVRSFDGGDINEGELKLERVRVAIYRFWEFCQTSRFFEGEEYRLTFDDKLLQLRLVRTTSIPSATACSVEITSDEPAITAVLSSTLTRSPLGQVRKKRALFVPPGPDGADRLLLEMYDHRHHLRVTSLYVRPPLPSYPDQVLEKLGVSSKVMRRKELAFEGYRDGRFEFLEILNEATIWDLIRYSSREGFKLYPRKVSQRDVENHIENLIDILRNYENYNLYITKMVIPFVVVTYEIHSQTVPEFITVFFQAFSSAAERDLGCFAMYDRAVYQNITDYIVQWLVNHPSTIKNRAGVIALLQRVLNHLSQHGPLGMETPVPE